MIVIETDKESSKYLKRAIKYLTALYEYHSGEDISKANSHKKDSYDIYKRKDGEVYVKAKSAKQGPPYVLPYLDGRSLNTDKFKGPPRDDDHSQRYIVNEDAEYNPDTGTVYADVVAFLSNALVCSEITVETWLRALNHRRGTKWTSAKKLLHDLERDGYISKISYEASLKIAKKEKKKWKEYQSSKE